MNKEPVYNQSPLLPSSGWDCPYDGLGCFDLTKCPWDDKKGQRAYATCQKLLGAIKKLGTAK